MAEMGAGVVWCEGDVDAWVLTWPLLFGASMRRVIRLGGRLIGVEVEESAGGCTPACCEPPRGCWTKQRARTADGQAAPPPPLLATFIIISSPHRDAMPTAHPHPRLLSSSA